MLVLCQVLDCTLIISPSFSRALLIEHRILKVVYLEFIPAALVEFLALRDGINIRDAITNLYVYIFDIGVGSTLMKHLDQISDPLFILHMMSIID